MAKQKTKNTTKKKKVEVEVLPEVTPTKVETPSQVVKHTPQKSSLLPKSISKPIEDLSKRVKVLEDLVTKLLSTHD